MEAEKPKIDIGFIKTYLESCIKWETQKRIAEETFNELTREENQWKQKMSYMVKKQHSRVSVIDMLLMAGKGFGIWLIILLGVVIVYDFFDNGNILVELMVSFVLLATMFVLVIGWPIYEKVTDYISIRNKFVSDQQREKNVKQQGNNALYIIQNNKDKLRQAYGYIINNLKNTYSANLIYKKYQTVEACAAIFEYLESGRCYTLEGPYGAYNKYDEELAKGVIISRLEEISTKIDTVISNQEKAYCVLQEIERNVNGMKQNISVICDSLYEMNGNIETIANNTIITTWASAVIATQVPDWREEARRKANKIYVQSK